MSRQAGLAQPVEVGGLLDLGHDVGGERRGAAGGRPGIILRGRSSRWPAAPSSQPCRRTARRNVFSSPTCCTLPLPAAHLAVQAGQVAFQHGRVTPSGPAGGPGGQANAANRVTARMPWTRTC